MNLYAVLDIPRDADDESIRNAYRILVRRYHPDRGIGSSPEKFRQVREAYETLIDPASRVLMMVHFESPRLTYLLGLSRLWQDLDLFPWKIQQYLVFSETRILRFTR